MKRTHIDLFDDNGWGWTFNNALISGGVLALYANYGFGQRSPDANWYSDDTDDFEVEVDFKQNSTPDSDTLWMSLYLVDGPASIIFGIKGNDDNMIIFCGGIQASQAFVDDTNWHTAKIRRVGTIFYFSIDSGAEISWDYGTARAINYFKLGMMLCTGNYDNFKYSYIELGKGTGIGNPLIL